MTDIQSWSPTASQNNDSAPDGFPEDIPLRDVDDSAREVMAAVRRQWNDAQWFNYGDGGKAGTYAFVAADQFRVVSSPATDVTAEYHIGRRVKVIANTPGTIYGTIIASSFSSPDTTVTVVFDSGELANEALTVQLSTQRADNLGTPGTIVVDDGTAAEPSIRFRGDIDSGLFLKAAGEIGLSVGGVESISFKDNGTLTGPKLGGWEHIDTKTSTNAEIDFIDLFSATYKAYVFVIHGLHLNTGDDDVRVVFRRVGEPNFDTSGYRWAKFGAERTNLVVPVHSATQFSSGLILNSNNVVANSARRAHGFLYVWEPQALTRTTADWEFNYTVSSGSNGMGKVSGNGSLDVSQAIDAVRFDGLVNNITAEISMYGLRNAV